MIRTADVPSVHQRQDVMQRLNEDPILFHLAQRQSKSGCAHLCSLENTLLLLVSQVAVYLPVSIAAG